MKRVRLESLQLVLNVRQEGHLTQKILPLPHVEYLKEISFRLEYLDEEFLFPANSSAIDTSFNPLAALAIDRLRYGRLVVSDSCNYPDRFPVFVEDVRLMGSEITKPIITCITVVMVDLLVLGQSPSENGLHHEDMQSFGFRFVSEGWIVSYRLSPKGFCLVDAFVKRFFGDFSMFENSHAMEEASLDMSMTNVLPL